ncbi:uncharacterized protein B0I36DRAFT_385039 [Microdochium trichocladiopsis]|uniref:LITAF domain-containing protein n=1 Tax=Microdochium trichocladiopsis TaxID=1682393 RepID=A0A9P9BT78_9PEZI|nr:uncharacterized protein B0I36DRAFT_385039 [Microdochium trichocladiopsis]KAH7029561.1 hypothetical protein B0I36DRAFT_385039 [Microdochium trichocladiopsis]
MSILVRRASGRLRASGITPQLAKIAGPAPETVTMSLEQQPQNAEPSLRHVSNLEDLKPDGPETIDCPSCHQRAQTTVKGRTDGMKTFMNVFWWPLPDRKHWWEETKWYCENCKVQVASQKHGKNIQVLV